MNHRERFRAVLEGRKPDRPPWTPRLKIWYEYHQHKGTLPEGYRGLSLEEIRARLGAGMPARGAKVYEKKLVNIQVEEKRDGDVITKYLKTPVGTVSETYRINKKLANSSPLRVEHFIKGSADYEVMKYVIENTHYEPCFDEYIRYDEMVGDAGFPLCIIEDVPINTILRDYIGYNRAYYELNDNREQVEELHQVLTDNLCKMQEIVLKSPGELFLHGMHFDSQMTPPPVFERYVVPYYRKLCPELNDQNKWLAVHQDADASLLLDLFLSAGIDVADCFACHPMVPCTLEDALKAWEDRIVIWGGIPSPLLCPKSFSDEEFEEHMDMVFSNIERGRMILQVADNVMPETDVRRLEKIASMVFDA